MNELQVIPNGCDLEIFCRSCRTMALIAVAENDLMSVFTGTHGSANGLDVTLDAAGELKRRGRKDIKLVLIGDGKLKP